MKNCTFCNVENPDDAVFCSSCGKTLADGHTHDAPDAGAIPPVPPVGETTPPAGETTYAPPPNQGYTPYSVPPVPPPAVPYQAGPGYQPPMPPMKPGDPTKNWAGITGMVLGILSIFPGCCTWYLALPLGIAAVIISVIGLKSQQKGMSIAGLVCGAIGILWGAFVLLFAVVFAAQMPAFLDDFYNEFGDYFDMVSIRNAVAGAFRNLLR